jgi:hypothetical protein
MSILKISYGSAGQVGNVPRDVRMLTDNTIDEIVTAGFFNNNPISGSEQLVETDQVSISLANNDLAICRVSIDSDGVVSFVPSFPIIDNLPTVENDLVIFSDTDGTLTDSGVLLSQVILTTSTAGQSISVATSSATPGSIRAIRGLITETASTMTSGTLAGARGEVDLVSASAGFVYGTQGKIIPTGTLSGSVWVAAIFGQFDVSAATVNAGQLAAIWGDWGTTGATATNLTGCRGIAFTNTTSNVLNAQDYRYGNATYLLELAGAGGTLNYYAAAGTSSGSAGNSTHCAAQQVIKVEINGVAAYIPVFTQNT